MTRTIKLAMAAAMALTATSAFATNGDNLMGLGAKARGMGGVGIATAFGAESGHGRSRRCLTPPAFGAGPRHKQVLQQ